MKISLLAGDSYLRMRTSGRAIPIVPGVRKEGKTKGVIPGGITPIRRSKSTLLPAEGPPLPFRPRHLGRTDQHWAGQTGPADTTSSVRRRRDRRNQP